MEGLIVTFGIILSDKGTSLDFRMEKRGEPLPEALVRKVKNFVMLHSGWSDAEFYKLSKKVCPFIQANTDSYLMIEFWSSDLEAVATYCNHLLEEAAPLQEVGVSGGAEHIIQFRLAEVTRLRRQFIAITERLTPINQEK